MISLFQTISDHIIVLGIQFIAVWCHILYRVYRFFFSGPHPPPLPPDDERLIVITGCDTGIGNGLAMELKEKTKCHVVPLCLTSESVQEFDKLKNDRVSAMRSDVTSELDVAQVKEKVTDLCGNRGLKLHGLVNNAGTISGYGGVLFFETPEKMIQTMNVNFFGMLRVTCALQRLLGRGSRIINMSSAAGTFSAPLFLSAYACSKCAVEAWSNDLAIELSPLGIHVTRVRPGAFATEMVKSGFSTIRKHFEAAPHYVQRLYGGDVLLERLQKFMSSVPKGDPSVVVDVLIDILECPKPDRSYWVGNDARWGVRALAGLNEYVKADICMMIFRNLLISEAPRAATCADEKRD